jgi:peptidoglycan/xylan/chitin deacetylase (PgdA/CDA1 family)
MRFPGLKTFKSTARWLRSRFVNGALILGYHRVAEALHDPYGIGVTPQHFTEQLQVLHQCANPISLTELVRGLRDGTYPQRAVALTFDDGYADFVYNVKPLLERFQIPATLFVTTGYIGREFWWDELEHVLFSPAAIPERLSLRVDGDVFEWACGDTDMSKMKNEFPGPRRTLLLSLHKRLLPLSSAEREQAMAQLKAWAGVEWDDRSHSRALKADELADLAAVGLVDIGAHTVTHPVLAELSVAAQRSQIQQSKSYLEELLARPVTSFSYPNGSASRETLAIVRNSGFVCACASHNDICWRGSDCFRLPRFWVPDWDGVMFSRWLQRWLK